MRCQLNPSLSTLVSDKNIRYDGTQLRSHWIYQNFGILGDALVAFTGTADVDLAHMVDLEDVKKKAPIYSPSMLHFIGEWFMDWLGQGILFQHLFVHTLYGLLWEKGGHNLSRRGNDIYYQERKLSVSICTKTPTSVVMHTGVNILTEGTPIPTSGLSELRLEPLALAEELLAVFKKDLLIWTRSRAKVLGRD